MTRDRLTPDSILRAGEKLASPNGCYELNMQGEGNLVLYRIEDGDAKPVWASNGRTIGSPADGHKLPQPAPCSCAMQGDGNLVLYNGLNQPYWSSSTFGQQSTLILGDDGRLVIEGPPVPHVVTLQGADPHPPTPPVPPIPPTPTFPKREGLVRTDRMRWFDDTGFFSPLGATLFWALRGWKYERDRVKRNLEFLATHHWDYVRILGEVGWSGNEIDPRWPDWDECLAGFLDCAYRDYGLRTEFTVTGGASFKTDYQQLAARTAAVVSERPNTILNLESFNESNLDIATGILLTRKLRTLLPQHMVATSCYGEKGELGSADYYIAQGANGATFHPDRSITNDQGGPYPDWMYRHARQTWDWKKRSTWVSVNEPGGPLSSVVPYNEVHHNVYSRAVAMLLGCAWVFHNGAGIYGQVQTHPAGGFRPANLWETPNVDAIMTALRGLDQYIPEEFVTGRYSHMSLQPHPLSSDHCWPADNADHGTVRDYASTIGKTWVQVLFGIKNYAQLTATMGACELHVTDPVNGYTTTKRLAAGESFRLDPQTKDSRGFGGFIVRGTVV